MKMRNLKEFGLEPDETYGPHPPASAAEISKFEKAFGHKLPEDYVQFLRDHNGDWPTREPTFRDGETEVQYFYYLRPEGEVEIDDPGNDTEFGNLWVMYRERGKPLGAGVLPIADTTDGSSIFFVYDQGKPWVGFIDLETGPPKRKRVERVADSFTEFINLLEVS